MLDKIDVRQIVLEHIRTLNHAKTQRLRPADLLLFFGLPLFVAAAAALFVGPISNGVVGVMATVHAILGGLMFNLLIVIYEVLRRAHSTGGEAAREKRARLLAESYRNIAFLVLTSVGILVLLLGAAVTGEGIAGTIISGTVYYLSAMFVLTLLMVLKRVHILLGEEISDQGGSSPTDHANG